MTIDQTKLSNLLVVLSTTEDTAGVIQAHPVKELPPKIRTRITQACENGASSYEKHGFVVN